MFENQDSFRGAGGVLVVGDAAAALTVPVFARMFDGLGAVTAAVVSDAGAAAEFASMVEGASS